MVHCVVTSPCSVSSRFHRLGGNGRYRGQYAGGLPPAAPLDPLGAEPLVKGLWKKPPEAESFLLHK